jgi:hypothetical protein
MNKTKTVIIHDVPKDELSTVIADLQRDGYNTSSLLEPDGTYTVTGTKEVAVGDSVSDNQ